MNPSDIATSISQRLGISFLWDLDPSMEPRGNVCFAQSPELRPEYRETFTLKDLIGYLYGLVYSRSKKEINLTDAKMFWELVKIGNEHFQDFKKEYFSVRPTIEIHPILGHNTVTQIKFDDTGKIWVNDMQYLSGIPTPVWKLCLHNEYPAKKWLENHLGKKLGSYEIGLLRELIEYLNEVCDLLNEIENPN